MTFIEQISLVSFAVIVVFGMAAYLRSHSRYENGIFHRAGCFLMYGYLKISLAAGYARRAVMMKLGSICSSANISAVSEEMYHKEYRMRELRRDLSHGGYGTDRHNLKIPG